MVNSYRYVFAASTSDLPSSGTTVDLGIGQIGVFDGKTYQATSGLTAKSILVAQGTPDVIYPHGVAKSNHTFKSSVIQGGAVKSWKKVSGQEGSGMVVTLGYDGVDTTKGLTVKQGKSFTYWVTLSGAPIANLLGDSPKTHYATWTEQFTVQLPCVSDCVDTCGDYFDQNIVADAVLDAFSTRKLIGGQLITDYVKATKLVHCDTPSGLPTTTYSVWTITIPDAGDLAALGVAQAAVEASNPGQIIKRVKREGIFSTYETVFAGAILSVTPAPVVINPNPVLVTCDTCPSGCPSGYTSQPATDIWVVARPLAGTENFTTSGARATYAATVGAAYSATAQEFLSYNGSTANIKIVVAAGTAVTALLADSVVQIATDQSVCTANSPLTYTFHSCKEGTAAEKQFVISILNDCTGNTLSALQAVYGMGVSLVTTNADTCVSQYSLTVESTNKDFEKCAQVEWHFEAPAPFNGLVWTEVPGLNYGTGCVTGIRFESVYEQRKAKECFLKQVAYEFEPLFITLSTRNPDPNDYSVLCETDVPHTLIKNVKYPKGKGRVVADQVIDSNFQFNQPWRKNAAERDAFDYELGIDLDGIYDQYILEFETFPAEASAVSGFGTSQKQVFELSVFFPVGSGSEYESTISAFVAANSPLALEVI